MQAITVSVNSWTDDGHSVNHLYDMLYMMNKDDIQVGVGGEGGISQNGSISSNIGGWISSLN